MVADIERMAEEVERTERRRSFGLTSAAALLQAVRPPDWLIPGFFERDSVGQIVGKPAAAKSTQAIDWCCRTATGTAWHGIPIEPRPVVYIAGEGRNGIARRLQAWSLFNDVPLENAQLMVSTQAAPLTDQQAASDVFTVIQQTLPEPPGLIVVDTLARNFGANENSTEDMSRFIDHVDTFLRIPFEACVLVVHHTGHVGRETGRGSSTLFGAADASYHMEEKNGLVTLRCTKMKDHESPKETLMRIRGIELPGRDHYGNPYSAPVLTLADASSVPHNPLGRNQARALELLRGLSKEYGADCDPEERVWVPLDRWRELCAEVGIDRRRWPEASTGLQERGMVEMNAFHASLSQ